MASEEHPLMVRLRAFERAWNHHDKSTVMEFFADGAIVRLQFGKDNEIDTVEEKFRDFVEAYLPGFSASYEPGTVYATHGRLRWVWAASGQAFQKRGLEQFDGMVTAKLRKGKIAELTLTEGERVPDVPHDDGTIGGGIWSRVG